MRADYDYLQINTSGSTVTISGVNKDGSSALLKTFTTSYGNPTATAFVDEYNGLLHIGGNGGYHTYDPETGVVSDLNISNDNPKFLMTYPWKGKNIIRSKEDGSIHIGENSAVFKEENGREKFWAQDANGKSIPIDITNGSKLLINGRDVEQSINNVGALSAALTGLPTVPTDTTLACGFGTGTHGGDFAFSGGCASRVNDKLSINYAASMTMPGQDYAGDFEDTFSARAGFVWKLGKSVKPNLISMKEKQKLTNEITDLKSENKKLNKKITIFETEKLELLARLERLEKIALSETNARDLVTIKLP